MVEKNKTFECKDLLEMKEGNTGQCKKEPSNEISSYDNVPFEGNRCKCISHLKKAKNIFDLI